MEFLADTWWIWLIVAVVLYIYALINRRNRIKRNWKSLPGDEKPTFGDFDESFNDYDQSNNNYGVSPFSGSTTMLLAVMTSGACFVLFVIGLASVLQ